MRDVRSHSAHREHDHHTHQVPLRCGGGRNPDCLLGYLVLCAAVGRSYTYSCGRCACDGFWGSIPDWIHPIISMASMTHRGYVTSNPRVDNDAPLPRARLTRTR